MPKSGAAFSLCQKHFHCTLYCARLRARVAQNDHRVDQRSFFLFVFCLFAPVAEQGERPLAVSASPESSTSTPPTLSSVISQPAGVAVNDIYCRYYIPALHVSGIRVVPASVSQCTAGGVILGGSSAARESACAISNGKSACRTVKSAWRSQLPVSRIRKRRRDSRICAA